MKAIIFAFAAALSLASCTSLSGDAQANAEKVFNTVCAAEPAVYVGLSVLAENNHWSAKKVQRLDQSHAVVNRLCTDRPTDLVTALTALSNAYRDVLAIKASSET